MVTFKITASTLAHARRPDRRGPAPAGIASSGYRLENDLAENRMAGFPSHLAKPVSSVPRKPLAECPRLPGSALTPPGASS